MNEKEVTRSTHEKNANLIKNISLKTWEEVDWNIYIYIYVCVCVCVCVCV